MILRTLPSGRLIVAASVATGTVAALAPPAAGWIIAAIGAGTWLLAWWDGRRALGTFDVRRDIPARIPQGEWAPVRWTLRARGATVRGLALAENHPAAVEGRGLEPEFDERPAGGQDRREGAVRPTRRGVFLFGPASSRVLGPARLGWRRVEAVPPEEIRVDPPVKALRRLSLETDRTRWRGGATRRLRGIGSEFESLRDYRQDDDSRWIDWKATARRGRMTAREYQVDEHQTVLFLVDTGRLMASEDGARSKLDHTVGAALAIGHAAMNRGDNLGLVAFDRKVHAELRPARGRGQSVRFHEALSRLHPSLVEPDYAGAFAHVHRRVRKRSLVLLFTDLVDERVSATLIEAVARARRRHLVVVVTLSDTELADRLARAPSDALGAYRNAVAADALVLRDGAVRRLRRSGVPVVDAPADELAAAAVETYLRVRRENRV